MAAGRAQPARLFGTHFRQVEAGAFGYTLSRATVPKEELPEHIHEDGQIILAVDPGYLSRAFDGDALGDGFDLVYNPPGTVHRDCFFDVGGRFLSIAIPRHLTQRAGDPLHARTPGARGAAARLLGLCLADELNALAAENVTLDLLAELRPAQRSTSAPPWLKQADEAIASAATRPSATIRQIAQTLGLHPVYFARAYGSARGFGPATALQRHRIASAVAMLSNDRSLAEIAASCGFADQSHLSRSIRGAFATTPTALRDAFGPARLQMFKTAVGAGV